MSDLHLHYLIAAALLALGVWLMLPRGRAPGFSIGLILCVISGGLLAAMVPAISGWVTRSVFSILTGVTLLAALLTVTSRNPVYCAIWFALSLLAAGGMLLIGGAQFLGVATVVVYAGAILVTFLFVLMLAQPEGHAFYDRVSWEAHFAAIAGAAMVGVLTLTVVSVLGSRGVKSEVDRMQAVAEAELPPVVEPAPAAITPPPSPDAQMQAAPATAPAAPVSPEVRLDPRLAQLRKNVLADEHMAKLGGQLFSRHLIAVEVAGTLLMVALVAAVAIVAHGRGVGSLNTELRIGTRSTAPGPKA